jgi:hypothetical protein
MVFSCFAAFAHYRAPFSIHRSLCRRVGLPSSASMRMQPAASTTTRSLTVHRASDRDIQLMEDILYRVRDVNRMPDEIRSSVLEFQVDGVALGKVRLLRSIDSLLS